MKTEAEKEAMQPQAKEHMANTGSWRRQESPPPQGLWRERGPATGGSQTSGHQNWGKAHFCCLKPPVCSNLLE